jgi:hypothetical protein
MGQSLRQPIKEEIFPDTGPSGNLSRESQRQRIRKQLNELPEFEDSNGDEQNRRKGFDAQRKRLTEQGKQFCEPVKKVPSLIKADGIFCHPVWAFGSVGFLVSGKVAEASDREI